MSFLQGLFSDGKGRERPLRDALIDALGGAAAGDGAGALDALAEAVRGRFQLGSLGLYVRDHGLLRRVALATDKAATDRGSGRPGPPEGAPTVAPLQNVGAAGPLSGSGWVALPGERVWGLAGDVRSLARGVVDDEAGARALAAVVLLAAHGLVTSQADRSQWIHDDVQRRVARAAADTRAAADLFLRMALTGLAGERGAVVSMEAGTGARVTWATAGAVAADAAGVDAVEASGHWVAEVVDAERFAPGARSVYAVARAHRGGVLVVAIASAAGATALSEVACNRLEQAVEVIRSLIEGQEETRRARARVQQLIAGLATMVEAASERAPGHHAAVAAEAARIGRRLGVGAERLRALVRAAEVHDVGRIGVAADPTGNVVEFLHPTVGGSLLDALGEPQEVTDLVRVHHERWDGQGFPLGVAPAEGDITAWALVAAQACVEGAGGAPGAEAQRAWVRDHGPGMLPPSALEKLAQGWE